MGLGDRSDLGGQRQRHVAPSRSAVPRRALGGAEGRREGRHDYLGGMACTQNGRRKRSRRSRRQRGRGGVRTEVEVTCHAPLEDGATVNVEVQALNSEQARKLLALLADL